MILRASPAWRSRVFVACSARGPPRAPSRRSMCALDAAAIDLTDAVERQTTEGDRIQVSTAPGADGIVRRIEVRAREAQHQLGGVRARQQRRRADRPPDRRAALPHGRLRAVLARPRPLAHRQHHAESGDRPERQDTPSADIFRITLDPGTVITYVVELRTDKLPQLYLWEPDAYKDKVNSFTLYHGIVIGIAGLLALFLTILFVVKGSVMFPGGRRARLGGAGLYRHRLRLLGQGVRHVGRRRARLARLGRGDPGGDAGGVPVRLSQSQPLARALCAHHRRLARVPRRADRGRGVRSGGRLRRRAHLARDRGGRGARRSWSISRRTASTARCC